MNKESKQKIVCAIMLGVIVIGVGYFGGLVGMKFVECPECTSTSAAATESSKPTIVTATPTPTAVNPVELENKTVQLEVNVTSEVETTPKVITAEDIDFVITQFYLEQPFLHLHAQTNIPRETILLEIIEIGDLRDIGISKIPIITDTNGMIFLDNQWVRFRNGYAYKANLYYNNNKIASSTSGLVEQGKASFGFVTLATRQPSQWTIRIITQNYYDMWLTLDGETNVPEKQDIITEIDRIVNNYPTREIRNVGCAQYIKIKPDRHGEINVGKERLNSVSVPLGEGYYKMTMNYKDRKVIIGFEVIKEKISEDENVFKGIHWVKNVYVPPAAI